MGSSELFNMRCIIALVLLLLPWFYIARWHFPVPQSSTFGKKTLDSVRLMCVMHSKKFGLNQKSFPV